MATDNSDSVQEMNSLKGISGGTDSENQSHTINTNCIGLASDAPVKNCVNNDSVISDKINSESDNVTNQPVKDSSKTESLGFQVDEDEVLGDDETGSKEFDSNNIDEDELLKDTEADTNIIETRSTFPVKKKKDLIVNESLNVNGPNSISSDKISVNENKVDDNIVGINNELEDDSSVKSKNKQNAVEIDETSTNFESSHENVQKQPKGGGELKDNLIEKSNNEQEAMDVDLNNTVEGSDNVEDDKRSSQDDVNESSQAGSSDTENKCVEEKASNEETISDDKEVEAVEEICIVPDRMQESSSDSKDVNLSENDNFEPSPTNVGHHHQISNKELKYLGIKDISTSSVESRTPSRPQRKAAQKAETQIKQVLLDNDDGVIEDDDDEDDADVDIEEIRYDEDEEDREGAVDVFEDNVAQEDEDVRPCTQCGEVKQCSINVITYGKTNYFCGEDCFAVFRQGGNVVTDNVPQTSDVPDLEPISIDDDDDDTPMPEVEAEMQDNDNEEVLPNRTTPSEEFVRKCSHCSSKIVPDDKTLSWETMDFCDEKCLGKYQTELGSHCANCKGNVLATSLGKYCVRFGYDIKQFCCASCLEEFKKGLKVCSFCQKDISSGAEGFLAPVGDKGQFKDFCTQTCMEKYEQMSNNITPPPETHPCNVCNMNKLVQVEVLVKSTINKLCSEVCFAAFKFVNHLKVGKCDMCRKYFNKESSDGDNFSVFYDDAPHSFCSKTCMNVYILAKRKIVPCNWCKVKKYNFDMIKRIAAGQATMMCSLNCLNLYSVSVNAVSSRRIKCDNCLQVNQAQYHLTMSDATIRNFCSYPCVINFQSQYSKTPITLQGNEVQPIPTGLSVNPAALPVISSVTSLASNGMQDDSDRSIPQGFQINDAISSGKTMYKQQILIKPSEPKVMCNKQTYTRPTMHTKGVSCRPHPCAKETQTEDDESLPKRTVVIPIPVPIYVPTPMAMYSLPFPVPLPFPIPIPVPIFVPTTRNSADGIMKQIKKIQEKMPTDPFEAELLMMAEMVAGEKKDAESSSEGEEESVPVEATEPCGGSGGEASFSPEAMESSNTFGDDMLQIALKMASELEGPAVDLEAALTPATITQPPPSEHTEGEDSEPSPALRSSGEGRGRKRSLSRTSLKSNASNNSTEGGTAQKRSRRVSSGTETPQRPAPPPQPLPPEEKPDANFKLKYTFGVNAWCQWVMTKNAELEKINVNNRKVKLFKPEILQLTADELNYSLCLFIKEMRKPNGQEYAPDTIYYLCLGIQQYLFENGRIDNIFTDPYYEKFTDCLDEIAKKFTEIYDDRQYIVTRVEEEHLWESKQLGAHSPHVLLSTLMFFNTKYFNLSNVDEHMQLSFSHIMKHWKRNPNLGTNVGGVAKVPGSRNVLLRFYPPQSAVDAPNSRKKKVYEQQENEENPLRCPVKLYEFYLSKCPESVRSRSDVFYLQPERSCVPDSPVWYSTMALGKEPLSKMLHRVKMVKEINIALLAT